MAAASASNKVAPKYLVLEKIMACKKSSLPDTDVSTKIRTIDVYFGAGSVAIRSLATGSCGGYSQQIVFGRRFGFLLFAGIQQTRVMTQLAINVCPTCGSRRIRRVKRTIESRRGGEPFTAHGIEIEECQDCGERLFGPKAMEQIAAQQPGARKRIRRRKSA
jgi:YgiT-type zinc finger domain-containing protein